MKWIGLLLIFSATTYCGYNFSAKIRERAVNLQLIASFFSQLISQISSTRTAPRVAVRQLALQSDFCGIPLIQALSSEITTTEHFGRALKLALASMDKVTQRDIDTALLPLMDTIGIADLATQQVVTKNVVEHIGQRQHSIAQQYKEKGELYRKMGVFVGLFFVVIMV